MTATAQHAKLPTEEAAALHGLDKSTELSSNAPNLDVGFESAAGCWAGCSAIDPETSLRRMAQYTETARPVTW
eukprot:COSAG02_NODE_13965_length_1326_cov_1.104319_2_plen_73_part_00